MARPITDELQAHVAGLLAKSLQGGVLTAAAFQMAVTLQTVEEVMVYGRFLGSL